MSADMRPSRIEPPHQSQVSYGEATTIGGAEIFGQVLQECLSIFRALFASLDILDNMAANLPIGGGNESVNRSRARPPSRFERQGNDAEDILVTVRF